MARRAGLAKADVVAAAARIADEGGLEAMTLRAVAERLGVRSPSLYAHVEGLEGLRRQLALRAAGTMAEALEASVEGKWGLEALRVLTYAYRTFAREHPGWYSAAQRALEPGKDDELYRALAAVAAPAIRALAEAGVEPAERIHLTRAMRSALHGFVHLEQIGGFGMPASIEESFGRMVELLIAGVRAAAATGSGRVGP